MGEMDKILSIIVPAYKVEKYLPKCLDSILAQQLDPEEYEVIVVDDGSPDSCGAIAEAYSRSNTSFSVLHKENAGLGAARNSGLDAASGKYVQFLDSDDYLEPGVLKSLIDTAEEKELDILRFRHRVVDEGYGEIFPDRCPDCFVDYSEDVTDGPTFLVERLGFGCYAWQFLIRRDLLLPSANSFLPGIFFEDTEWTPRIMLQAKRVASADIVAYNYMCRRNSITQAESDSKKAKVLEDKLSLVSAMKERMMAAEDPRWFAGMISSLVISILDSAAREMYSNRGYYIKALRVMGVYPLSSYHMSHRAQRKLAFINISPSLYCRFSGMRNR